MKPSKSDWLIPAGLMLLSIVPALGGASRLGQLTGNATVTAENARFFAMPIPIVIHILSAIVYSVLGALQFSPGFRRRRRGWHRAAGRILVPAALLVSVSGLWMTLVYPWANNDGELVFAERLVFGSAMLVSVILGVDAIRRRKFSEHGAWMIRAYAIGLGAGTQVFTHLPWFIFVDMHPPEMPRAVMMGLGWLINAAIAEWIIRRPATKLTPAVATA